MDNLWAPWRMTYVTGTSLQHVTCILCDLHDHATDVSAHVLHIGELSFLCLNRYPYSSGHVMVVPNRHVDSITELTDAEASALMVDTRVAMRAISAVYEPDGFNVGFNVGSAAGGSIPHLHVHVVPRWNGDTNFLPIVGNVKVMPEELDTTFERLRSQFPSPST